MSSGLSRVRKTAGSIFNLSQEILSHDYESIRSKHPGIQALLGMDDTVDKNHNIVYHDPLYKSYPPILFEEGHAPEMSHLFLSQQVMKVRNIYKIYSHLRVKLTHIIRLPYHFCMVPHRSNVVGPRNLESSARLAHTIMRIPHIFVPHQD
jgi:hypothetical protein